MEDFGHAKDEVTVRNGLEDFFAEPLSEFYHSFLTCPPMPSSIYFNVRRCFGFKPVIFNAAQLEASQAGDRW